MNVAGCLIALHDTAFVRLGTKALLLWSAAKLREVRGIEPLLCLVKTDTQMTEAQAILPRDYEVLKVPHKYRNNSDYDLYRWLCCSDGHGLYEHADVVVALRPGVPFLKRGAIERCLDAVRTEQAKAALTTTKVDIVTEDIRGACMGIREGHRDVNGVRAFDVDELISTGNDCLKWSRNFAMIPVSSMEALDVLASKDNLQMAQALISAGAA